MHSVAPRRARLDISAYPVRQRPFSRICVAVDASESAESAARLALSLVHDDRRAEIVFCHVINLPRMIARAEQSLDDYGRMLDLARETARVMHERCLVLAREAHVVATAQVRYGAPAAEVQALAASCGADLVVIGNRPAPKLQRLLRGSVRDELVRTCRLPLLIADAGQARAIDFRLHRVLLAGSDAPQAYAAKRFAAKLAIDFAAQLVLLPAVHTGIVREKSTIDRAVRELRPGLIVMTGPEQRGWRNVFAADVVERVVQDARIPLLIVRPTTDRAATP